MDGRPSRLHTPVRTVPIAVSVVVALLATLLFSSSRAQAEQRATTAWAWGWGPHGSFCSVDTWYGWAHVQDPATTDWASVFTGSDYTALIGADGTLWTCGGNYYGQLGVGDKWDRDLPSRVGTDTNWAVVGAGAAHTLAVKTDGTLWAWGSNQVGELGLGDTSERTVPTQVGTDTDWASVASVGSQSFAIKTDGTLWAWGWNGDGKLGLGDTENRTVPTQVGTDTDWASVVGSYYVINGDPFYFTIAIKTDGTLWAWGSNGDGELGLGDTGTRTVPTQVGTDANWAMVAAGYGHTLAIKTDGTMWAWGGNGNGQLGLGDTETRFVPTQVGTDTDWAMVAAGVFHSVAIKTDGTLWAWGWNSYGQLGLGDTSERTVPTQVGTETDWTAISAGDHFNIGLRTLIPGSISGTATDGSGTPMAGVKVGLLDNNYAVVAKTVTDATGAYSFQGVYPGSYKMYFAKDGYDTVYNSGVYGRGRAPWVVVPEGVDLTQDASMRQARASISGTVTGVVGLGVQGAKVRLFDGDANLVAATTTDGWGNYAFSGLDPDGRYKVRVIAMDDPRYAATFNGGASGLATAAWIELDPGQAEVVDIALRQIVTVTGSVRDSDDAPVPGAYVILRDRYGNAPNLTRVVTDGEGNYTLTGLAPGSFTLLAKYTDNYALVWHVNSPKKSGATVIDAAMGDTYYASMTLPVHP